jgi:hypothetical protein
MSLGIKEVESRVVRGWGGTDGFKMRRNDLEHDTGVEGSSNPSQKANPSEGFYKLKVHNLLQTFISILYNIV